MADIVRTNVVRIDLANGNIVRNCNPVIIGENDAFANEFGVEVYRDGQPVDISGANVTGYFIRSNNTTVIINGGIVESGSVAKLTLPQACYAFQGQFSLAIKLTGGDVTGTLRVVYGSVENTTSGTPIDPGHVIPTLEELLAKIGEMEAATAAAQAVVDEYDTKVAVQDAKIEAVETNDALQDTNIATNTANITALESNKADKAELNRTNRVLSALVEAGKGKILRFETDTDSAYAKSVPSGALNATTTEWGGKSVVWNQLQHNNAIGGTSSGVTIIKNEDGSFTLNGTAENAITILADTPTSSRAVSIVGHKYYIFADSILPENVDTRYLISGSVSITGSTTFYTENDSERAFCAVLRCNTGATFNNLTVRLFLVDLTTFGASDITSVDDPRIASIKAYAMAHPEYNVGEIVSADVVSVNTVGKNLYSGVWENTASYGYVYKFHAKAGQTVCVYENPTGSTPNDYTYIDGYRDNAKVNLQSISNAENGYWYTDEWSAYYNPKIFTMTEDSDLIIYCAVGYNRYGADAASHFNELQIEIASARTAYAPYHAEQHPIPSAVQALDGYGIEGNEISYDASTEKWYFTKNKEEKSLSDLTWSRNNTYHCWQTTVTGIKRASSTYTVGDIVAKYETVTYGKLALDDGTICIGIRHDSDVVFCRTETASITPSGKTVYALSTPIVTDITDLMGTAGTDLIAMAVESGGTITFAQANGTIFPVPNSVTYTVKISEVE